MPQLARGSPSGTTKGSWPKTSVAQTVQLGCNNVAPPTPGVLAELCGGAPDCLCRAGHHRMGLSSLRGDLDGPCWASLQVEKWNRID